MRTIIPITAMPSREDLREAICSSLMRDYGVKRNPENVLVTVGGLEAINVPVRHVPEPGDEALVFDPGYSAYAVSVTLFGAGRFRPVDGGFHIDFDLLRAKISERSKIIFNGQPQHPTAPCCGGRNQGLARVALEHDLLIVMDEVYHKLIYSGERHVSIARSRRQRPAILLNSFSRPMP